jgi:hypothetical protein
VIAARGDIDVGEEVVRGVHWLLRTRWICP